MVTTGKGDPLRFFKDVVFFIGQLAAAMRGSGLRQNVKYAPLAQQEGEGAKKTQKQ